MRWYSCLFINITLTSQTKGSTATKTTKHLMDNPQGNYLILFCSCFIYSINIVWVLDIRAEYIVINLDIDQKWVSSSNQLFRTFIKNICEINWHFVVLFYLNKEEDENVMDWCYNVFLCFRTQKKSQNYFIAKLKKKNLQRISILVRYCCVSWRHFQRK